MTVKEIGDELVALCRQGKNLEAIEKLYSPDIVSVEAMAMPDAEQTQTGIEAIKGKNKWWVENHEMHGGEVDFPKSLRSGSAAIDHRAAEAGVFPGLWGGPTASGPLRESLLGCGVDAYAGRAPVRAEQRRDALLPPIRRAFWRWPGS